VNHFHFISGSSLCTHQTDKSKPREENKERFDHFVQTFKKGIEEMDHHPSLEDLRTIATADNMLHRCLIVPLQEHENIANYEFGGWFVFSVRFRTVLGDPHENTFLFVFDN